METKGHIISDEQFSEYQQLLRDRYIDICRINIIRIYESSYDFVAHSDAMFNIKFSSPTFTEDVSKLVIAVEDKCKEANRTTAELIKSAERRYNHAQETISRFQEEIKVLAKKREKLLKSPTIWEFIKNRKSKSNGQM